MEPSESFRRSSVTGARLTPAAVSEPRRALVEFLTIGTTVHKRRF
jgi:hypothetical protein